MCAVIFINGRCRPFSADGKYRPEAINDQVISMPDRFTVFTFVMAGLRPGHPRLSCLTAVKTWMPGTRPGMTNSGWRLRKIAEHAKFK
jgi:hypothetical protein